MDDYQPIGLEEATGDVAEDGSGRRAPRDSMYLAATIRVGSDVEAVPVRVRNVSAGGLMADGMPRCNVGDLVTLTLGRIGDVGGQVAWIEPERAGIAFLSPIDPRLVRRPVGTASGRQTAVPAPRTRRSGLRAE